MGDSSEDMSRDCIFVFDQDHVGFRLSREYGLPDTTARSPGHTQGIPGRTCHSHEFWNCLHCEIAFKGDFVDRVIRSGGEHSYDTLVQFGNAPITSIVNLQ